jgi:uncharacterized protein
MVSDPDGGSRPPQHVKCPRCGKSALFTPENAFRPFCSERCKLIDLGNWAEGKYAIPVAPSADTQDSPDEETHDDDEDSGSGFPPVLPT